MKRSDIKITLVDDDPYGEVYIISRPGGSKTWVPRDMAKEFPNAINDVVMDILKREPFEIDVVEY